MKQTKKLLLVLLCGIALVGCQKKEVAEKEEFKKVEKTDVKIVSPETPSALSVNGKETKISTDKFLKVGDTLASSSLVKPTKTFDTMETIDLASLKGVKIIHSVPSLDTPVCSLQTRQLDDAAKEFKNLNFITISQDLPFALQRFGTENSLNSMQLLSDFQGNNFAKNNNLFLPEYSLSARSIIVVDANNEVLYVEYAKEITEEINVDNVINFIVQNKLDK